MRCRRRESDPFLRINLIEEVLISKEVGLALAFKRAGSSDAEKSPEKA
jgi:hypothetical protein